MRTNAIACAFVLAACGDEPAGGPPGRGAPEVLVPERPASGDPLPGTGAIAPGGLPGPADPGCLSIAPRALALVGEVAGCATAEATVTVTNRCAVPVLLDRVSLDADGPFFVRAAPPLPAAIGAGAATPVVVGYRPLAPGDHAGELRLGFAGLAPLPIALSGSAGEGTWRTERFSTGTRRPVDVLFVIDNGHTMAARLFDLENNLRPFVDFAGLTEFDFRIGVTTTGLAPGGDCPGGVGGGEDGRLFPVIGETPRVLTFETPDVEAVWIENFSVGACREGPNPVLEAALRALTPPVADSADDPRHPEADDGNAGFLRPEALLSIVAITDRADTSPGDPGTYHDAIQRLKGVRNRHLFEFHAITGDPGGGCTAEGRGPAEPGDRLITLANLTDGGVFQSICAGDWSTSLREMAGVVYDGQRTCYGLGEPVSDSNGNGEVLDTDGELEVRLDGEVVPSRGPQGQQLWGYFRDEVCFAWSFAPGYGHGLEVRYRPACW